MIVPRRMDFCEEEGEDGGAVHRAIHAVMHLIEDHARKRRIPTRFAATKLIEGDELILNQLDLEENEVEMLEHIVTQMEEESGQDRMAALADMRFRFIERTVRTDRGASGRKPRPACAASEIDTGADRQIHRACRRSC